MLNNYSGKKYSNGIYFQNIIQQSAFNEFKPFNDELPMVMDSFHPTFPFVVAWQMFKIENKNAIGKSPGV